jgi:hypothetical protein
MRNEQQVVRKPVLKGSDPVLPTSTQAKPIGLGA